MILPSQYIEKGWVKRQDRKRNKKGEITHVCTYEAIYLARVQSEKFNLLWAKYINNLIQHIEPFSKRSKTETISEWNDSFFRRKSQVIKALKYVENKMGLS